MSEKNHVSCSRRIAILGIAIFLLSTTGLWAGPATEAAERAEPRRTLIAAYPADPRHMDTMITTAPPPEPRLLVFEELFAMNYEQIPQPLLAKSAELSADELTWTIKLRDNVHFHDGQKMTSADVVASWGRFIQVGARAWEVAAVKEVVAIDDYTLEFRLSRRYGSLLEAIAAGGGGFAVYPKWVVDEIGTDNLVEARHSIGTGTYKIDRIVTEERYIFSRYEGYTQPPGETSYHAGYRNRFFDVIDVRVIPDNATRAAALLAGDVDTIQAVPLDDAKRFVDNPNTYIVPTMPGYRVYIKFNLMQGPFADPVLREAVRMAVDAEEMMMAIGDSEFWRVNHAMRYQEEQWTWSGHASQFYINDMEQARKLVEKSSYNGELIRFMASPGRPLEYRMVVPLQQKLRQLGLNVEIMTVDAATFSAVRRQLGEWEIKHAGGGSMASPIYLGASVQARTGDYWPGLPEEWHEMMSVVEAERDQALRKAAVDRLHEIHTELNAELWIGDVFELVGARSDITNFSSWPYRYLWQIERK